MIKSRFRKYIALCLAALLFAALSGCAGGGASSAPPQEPLPVYEPPAVPAFAPQPEESAVPSEAPAEATDEADKPPASDEAEDEGEDEESDPDDSDDGPVVLDVDDPPELSSLDNMGEIVYGEEAARLDPRQEDLLLDFMDAYYTSLSELEVRDISTMFAKDASVTLEFNLAVWEIMVDIRAAQRTDLSLSGYEYTLSIERTEPLANGGVRVFAEEDYTCNFTAYPGVDTRAYNVGHSFTIVFEDDEYLLAGHRQYDSLNSYLMGHTGWEYPPPETITPGVSGRKELFLTSALSAAEARQEDAAPDSGIDLDYSHSYDRDAAVTYAIKWVGTRNIIDWAMYDLYGGNCQNFTSQAMFAGGIPMDYSGEHQWKWYGDVPNELQRATGRSAAWSGVEDFLEYVRENTGGGMVAQPNAPHYTGEEGDVVHMGILGEWRHTVMIHHVFKDADGETLDYLVASNSADLINYPLSAHYYQQQMLIKILGWN